jgi:hypothetical protein
MSEPKADYELKIFFHQRLRLPGGGNACGKSCGEVNDNTQPGSGGLSLYPQVTPRLLGSNILIMDGCSRLSAYTIPQ